MDTDRAASPPTSETSGELAPTARLRFLDASGSPIDAPREWEPALLELIIDPEGWEDARLSYQGGELAVYAGKLGGRRRVLADWPRSGAGHYRLQLHAGGHADAPLTVTVRSRKISQGQFAQLIADLEYKLPSEVALSIQRLGALSGIRLLPPTETTLSAEVFRLRRAVSGHDSRPGLRQVLALLGKDPHSVLRPVDLWATREQARRPHAARLAQAISRGQNLARDYRPLNVLDTRVEHSFDVYENRLVKTFHDQVERRLRRLLPALRASSQTEAYEEMLDVWEALRKARRDASFLNEVSRPSYLPTRVTMVLLNRPLYRAALEGYVEFHRSASVRLDDAALDSPLENLPTLYQHWGTLQIITSVLGEAAELGYVVKEQSLVKRAKDDFYVQILPDGLTAVSLEHAASPNKALLIVERRYVSTGHLRSVSYEQRPDVTLEVYPEDGRPRLYLFDPKYKFVQEESSVERSDGRPKKEDIDKMHSYRDAIRDSLQNRVVEYAAILYPGTVSNSYGRGLEAVSAVPGQDGILQQHIRSVVAEALS